MVPRSRSFDDALNLIYDHITRIIVAEDLLINLEVIKIQLTETGMISRCSFCTNCQETIDVTKRYINQILASTHELKV